MEKKHDITDKTLFAGYIPEAIALSLSNYSEGEEIGLFMSQLYKFQAKRWIAFQEDRKKSLSQHMDHYAGPSK